MTTCPICNAPQTDDECHCGFSFVEKRIVNRELIRSHMAKLKHDSWQQLIKTKHRIDETQKLGVSKTAELLGETKGLTSNHLKLAQALIAYPELESCPNISRANERLKQLSNSAIPGDGRIVYETDLQDILFFSWSTIPEFAHFNLVNNDSWSKGKFNTCIVGEIDLLAQHETNAEWLIVELKKDKPSDAAIGQTLRYMGWVRMYMACHQGSVRGTIIASAIDDALYFALQCVPTLEAFTYSISGGRIDLCRFDPAKKFMDGLSTEQIRKLLEDPRIRGSQ